MGMTIDEYIDMKLQQKRFSKTIDTLWIMAQKYQKIEQILDDCLLDDWEILKSIREVVEDGRN